MQFRNQVEWALSCCVLLALSPPSAFVSTKALASTFGAPKEYLSKALQSLSKAATLESSAGSAGGYRLARQPSSISVLEIVDAIEGGPAFQCTGICEGVFGIRGDGCRCGVTDVMQRANSQWRSNLAGVTLEQLADETMPDAISHPNWGHGER
jgi:Rrf2 family protein